MAKQLSLTPHSGNTTNATVTLLHEKQRQAIRCALMEALLAFGKAKEHEDNHREGHEA